MLRPAALLVVTLLLTGCVPSEPVITPAPEPSASPIFASDEEALAAATDALTKYLSVSDGILADGGKNPERILTVATAEWAKVQYAGYDKALSEALHGVGSTSFDRMELQKYDRNSIDGVELVRIYVCVDLSKLDVVNSDGHSVVSEARPDRTPFEVAFDLSDESSNAQLLVASETQWEGNNFCD